MKKINYMLGYYGLLVPGVLWLTWALTDSKIEEAIPFAAAMVLAGMITPMVLVYRMWSAIQDGETKPSPVAALGLLFVPFFNLYWIWRVYPGFADEYNKYIDRHGLNVEPLSPGPYKALAVCTVLGVLPIVGIATSLACFVLMGIVISRTCDAVARLKQPPTAPPVAKAA